MRLQRILTLVYALFGVIAGLISNLFTNLTIAASIPLGLYLISYLLLAKFINYKKKSWLVINSLITFILIWMVVWIFLFNIK